MTARLPPRLVGFARQMRHVSSPIEAKLWTRLKNRGLNGLKFRRQFVCEKYICDFACPEHMLVVELDGDTHAAQENYDKSRQQRLEELGYKVLRFPNREITDNLDGVLETILLHAHSIPSS